MQNKLLTLTKSMLLDEGKSEKTRGPINIGYENITSQRKSTTKDNEAMQAIEHKYTRKHDTANNTNMNIGNMLFNIAIMTYTNIDKMLPNK